MCSTRVDVKNDNNDQEATVIDNTANKLQEIANNIQPDMVTMEVDTANNYIDGKTPVMDLYMWVDGDDKIRFSHHRKKVANNAVVWSNSGMSTRTKQNILFQEGMRRLKNMHPDLSWNLKANQLSDLNLRMRQAGYSDSFRQTMLIRIVTAYNKILTAHKDGFSMYQTDRQKTKKDKTEWIRKTGHDITAALPLTVDNKLRNKLSQALSKFRWKIKFVDSLGPTINSQLMRSNHNPPAKCDRDRCVMCSIKPSNMRCHKSNIGYRFLCHREPCVSNLDLTKLSTDKLLDQLSANPGQDNPPAVYEGESFRVPYRRGLQHLTKYTGRNKDSSWMWNHTKEVHGGVIGDNKGLFDYRFVLLDNYRDNLSRQSSEGFRQLQFEKKQTQNRAACLNSKIDYIRPFKTHLSVNRGNINSGPGRPGPTPTNQPPHQSPTQPRISQATPQAAPPTPQLHPTPPSSPSPSLQQMSSTVSNYSTVPYSTPREITHTETITANNLLTNSYSDQASSVSVSQTQNIPDRAVQNLADVGRHTQMLTVTGRTSDSRPQTLTDSARTDDLTECRQPEIHKQLTSSQGQIIAQLRPQPHSSESTSKEGDISSGKQDKNQPSSTQLKHEISTYIRARKRCRDIDSALPSLTKRLRKVMNNSAQTQLH